jgi:hypothetical protein
MKIEIEINEENISNLLNKFGYVTEEVLVWYNKLDEWCFVKDLGNYHKTVAYPRYHRPEILNKEKIMFDDVKDIGIKEIVNMLFNELLINKLFD